MDKKYFAIRKGENTGIFYETYAEVQKRKPKEFKSFKRKEEAEAYMNNQIPIGNTDGCENIDVTKADAVIYADGSLNFDYPKMKELAQEQWYATYGLLIFFKENKTVYFETGKVMDGKEKRVGNAGVTERNFYVWRYGMNSERVNKAMEEIARDAKPEEFWYEDVYRDKINDSEETNARKHGFVLASGSDAGEMEGVKRGLEICLEEKGLKNVVIVHDLEIAPNIYNGGYDKKKNEPVFYGKLMEKYRLEDGIKPQFIKVKSHESGKAFVHGVYNDCADILAKAETNARPIGGKTINPNLEELLGYGIKDKVSVNDIPMRRKETRRLINEAIRLEPEDN